MKFLFSLLFLFLFSSSLLAQCPATCTITVSIANGNLSQDFNTGAGTVICIIDGTYTGNINVDGATTICVSSGATYSGGGSQNSTATIINRGNWTSTIDLKNGSSFLNTGTGTINTTGSLATCSTCSLISENTSTVVSGGITNDGIIQINGNANINGNINNNSGGDILFGSATTITGAISNNGDMQFDGDATIGGSFTNNSGGEITVNNSTISIGGSFANNGDIVALGSCGRINIAGASVNNGGGNVGMDNSNVDICGNGGAGFNAENGNTGPNVTNCTCVPIILPITLTSFTAKEESNTRVYINWQTVWEMDNEYFQVERSFSGTDFQVITQISVQKNGEEAYKERNYSFIDNLTDKNLNFTSLNQTIYYRLKQVDTNGEFSYSPVVAVQIEIEKNEEIKLMCLQNEWQLRLKNPVQVKVYSSTGVLKGTYNLNPNQSSILVSNLPKGMYILHIQDSKTSEVTVLKVIR